MSVRVPHAEIAAWARTHPLLALFAIAFGVTWTGAFAQVAASHGFGTIIPTAAAAALTVLGCPLAALSVARATGGIAARNALLRRYLRWRVGLRWYALALAGPPSLLLLAAVIADQIRGRETFLHVPSMTPSVLLNSVLAFFLYVRGNWEEMCWRGAALPLFQAQYDPLAASLGIGVIWGVWHLPYYFISGHAVQLMGMPAFVVFTVGGSILLTWLFNSTGGSLLLVTMFHAAFGTGMQLLIQASDPLALYIMTALVAAAATAVLLMSGSRLGLRTPRPQEPALAAV